MARRPVLEGGKKEEILDAATRFFFERGFEATSVRSIMKEVGSEAGLFYYYFKNKDDLFHDVLERFFYKYKEEADSILENGRRDTFRLLMTFIDFFASKVREFNAMYEDSVHRTVRMSLREHALKVIEPYIREILDIIVAAGARLQLSVEATTIFIAHGVGSIILHNMAGADEEMTAQMKLGVNTIMGLNPLEAELMFPYFAEESDIAGIHDILDDRRMYMTKPEIQLDDDVIKKKIEDRQIFVIRYNGRVVGVCGFDIQKREVEYISVLQDYEKKGIGMRLLVSAMARFQLHTRLSVRMRDKGDYASANIKKFLEKYGFKKLYELSDIEQGVTRMVTMIEER